MRPRQADDDAKDFLRDNFLTEIVEALINEGEVSDDINNDYPNGDGLFHEEITDKEYSPEEAIAVLEYYGEHEETDSGLWEGLGWRQMLSAIAAYTYANAVRSEITELFEQINEIDVDAIRVEALNPEEDTDEEMESELFKHVEMAVLDIIG